VLRGGRWINAQEQAGGLQLGFAALGIFLSQGFPDQFEPTRVVGGVLLWLHAKSLGFGSQNRNTVVSVGAGIFSNPDRARP
jgi:hypothetical protein